jgi:hypothetical protein
LHNIENLENIEKARALLNFFSSKSSSEFGRDILTFTFHHLVKHLIDDCIDHGSMRGHSMFSVESIFGTLGKKLNGTRGFSNQFIRGSIYFLIK